MEENLKQQYTEIIKISIFGPESTGKTTLAKQLAEHFKTNWTPEFAREYLQQKWDNTQEICEPKDLLPIAVGQIKLENAGLLSANKFLFCDTCLMVTKVFSEIHYGFCDPVLDQAAINNKYDLFFLTDIDVPWKKDDLRDAPQNRASDFAIFKKALVDNNKPFIILSGDIQSRLEKAIKICEDLHKAKALGFSSHDFISIYNKGIDINTLKYQTETIINGQTNAVLINPAKIDEGISKFTEQEIIAFSNYFEDKKDSITLEKFVPASGAATRMFKFLIDFLSDFNIENESIDAYLDRKKANELALFITGLEKFPFFETVDKKLREANSDFENWSRFKKNNHFVKFLLSPEYLNFSNKPKAVIPFHEEDSKMVTPIEEHLKESVLYANSKGVSNLHFTISEAHQSLFEEILNEVQTHVEKKNNKKINVQFSFQNSNTDTIALDADLKFLKDENGNLVFRPAGHGALINNLNQLNADVVFIKNIDNVSHNHLETISLYKKALAGILLQLQHEIFRILTEMDAKTISENDLNNTIDFIATKLQHTISDDFYKYTFENKCNYIKEILNRPIRVCGMVKNEGEPGGGPFWVSDAKGNVSLQIIESSQVDTKNPKQEKILSNSTHFNPVDLVCGIKDYKGNKFNLSSFVDPKSGFVVDKNHNGKPIKSYELPGLWNGSMAKWTTLFVEVPLSTFNPVKTVNDLLKTAHQPN